MESAPMPLLKRPFFTEIAFLCDAYPQSVLHSIVNMSALVSARVTRLGGYFAYWTSVYFGQFFLVTEETQIVDYFFTR
jgi:hypothetical protein